MLMKKRRILHTKKTSWVVCMALEDVVVAALLKELINLVQNKRARIKLKKRIAKILANGNKKQNSRKAKP